MAQRFLRVATAASLTVGCIGAGGPVIAGTDRPAVRTSRSACASPTMKPNAASHRPRVVIMNDGEVDDMDSFIRYLYYANEFDTAAIVLTSSIYHYAGNGASVKPYRWTGTRWLPHYLDLYAKIYGNLSKHAPGYPTPDQLRHRHHVGNIATTSDTAADTDGSRAIARVILDNDPRPVNFQAWGGLNTLARALKSIEKQYRGTTQWTRIQAKVNRKVVVYNILNQDNTLAAYIRPRWPRIRVINNQDQFWSFAYEWPKRVPAQNQYVLKAPWVQENLLRHSGPLMERYRTYRDGKPTPGDDENNRWRRQVSAKNQNVGYRVNDIISEGDSPAFLYLLDSTDSVPGRTRPGVAGEAGSNAVPEAGPIPGTSIRTPGRTTAATLSRGGCPTSRTISPAGSGGEPPRATPGPTTSPVSQWPGLSTERSAPAPPSPCGARLTTRTVTRYRRAGGSTATRAPTPAPSSCTVVTGAPCGSASHRTPDPARRST